MNDDNVFGFPDSSYVDGYYLVATNETILITFGKKIGQSVKMIPLVCWISGWSLCKFTCNFHVINEMFCCLRKGKN